MSPLYWFIAGYRRGERKIHWLKVLPGPLASTNADALEAFRAHVKNDRNVEHLDEWRLCAIAISEDTARIVADIDGAMAALGIEEALRPGQRRLTLMHLFEMLLSLGARIRALQSIPESERKDL